MFIHMNSQANSSESSTTPPNPRASLGAMHSPRQLTDDLYMCSRCSKLKFHSEPENLRDVVLRIRNQSKTDPILSLTPPYDEDQNLAYWASLMALGPPPPPPVSSFRRDFGLENGQGFIPILKCPGNGTNDGYETLSRAHRHHLDLNYPPCPMPQPQPQMVNHVYVHKSDYAARAGEGAWFGESSNAVAAAAYMRALSGEEKFNESNLAEKLDLTLKL